MMNTCKQKNEKKRKEKKAMHIYIYLIYIKSRYSNFGSLRIYFLCGIQEGFFYAIEII